MIVNEDLAIIAARGNDTLRLLVIQIRRWLQLEVHEVDLLCVFLHWVSQLSKSRSRVKVVKESEISIPGSHNKLVLYGGLSTLVFIIS